MSSHGGVASKGRMAYPAHIFYASMCLITLVLTVKILEDPSYEEIWSEIINKTDVISLLGAYYSPPFSQSTGDRRKDIYGRYQEDGIQIRLLYWELQFPK